MHSIAEKGIAHHLGRSAELCFVDDGLVAHEHPLIPVQAFNADTGFITGHGFGLTQIADNVLFCDLKRLMAAFQHIGQRALAHLHAKHFIKHPCKPRKRDRLKGLQIENQSVQPGAKRRAIGGRWQRAFHAGLTVGTANAQPAMPSHKRRYRRQVDLVVIANDIGRQMRL